MTLHIIAVGRVVIMEKEELDERIQALHFDIEYKEQELEELRQQKEELEENYEAYISGDIVLDEDEKEYQFITHKNDIKIDIYAKTDEEAFAIIEETFNIPKYSDLFYLDEVYEDNKGDINE